MVGAKARPASDEPAANSLFDRRKVTGSATLSRPLKSLNACFTTAILSGRGAGALKSGSDEVNNKAPPTSSRTKTITKLRKKRITFKLVSAKKRGFQPSRSRLLTVRPFISLNDPPDDRMADNIGGIEADDRYTLDPLKPFHRIGKA